MVKSKVVSRQPINLFLCKERQITNPAVRFLADSLVWPALETFSDFLHSFMVGLMLQTGWIGHAFKELMEIQRHIFPNKTLF